MCRIRHHTACPLLPSLMSSIALVLQVALPSQRTQLLLLLHGLRLHRVSPFLYPHSWVLMTDIYAAPMSVVDTPRTAQKQATPVLFAYAEWHPEPVRSLRTTSQVAAFTRMLHRESMHVDPPTSPDIPLHDRAYHQHSEVEVHPMTSPDQPLAAHRCLPCRRLPRARAPRRSASTSSTSSSGSNVSLSDREDSTGDEYSPPEPERIISPPRSPSPAVQGHVARQQSAEQGPELYGGRRLLSGLF